MIQKKKNKEGVLHVQKAEISLGKLMGTAEKVRGTFPMDGFIAFKYIICVRDLQGKNGQSITYL